jgi:molecular chaperone Hsp33
MINDHISRNITKSNYRIVLVRATQVAQLIGSDQHQLSGLALSHFSDGILSALLLATQLKGTGVLSVEFDSNGPFDNYRCDATPLGLVRAMIPSSTFDKIQKWDGSQPLVGKGNLYIGKKIESAKQPFSSVLELVSQEFTKNISNYLMKSEQINGVVSLCTIVEGNQVLSCDGFMIEEMPKTTQADRDLMEKQIKRMSNPQDIFIGEPDDNTVLAQILGDINPVHIKDFEVAFYCPCSRDRFIDNLSSLPRDDIQHIANEKDLINTQCDFCKKEYEFTLIEIFNRKDYQN